MNLVKMLDYSTDRMNRRYFITGPNPRLVRGLKFSTIISHPNYLDVIMRFDELVVGWFGVLAVL